jgi:hypothetical protein
MPIESVKLKKMPMTPGTVIARVKSTRVGIRKK